MHAIARLAVSMRIPRPMMDCFLSQQDCLEFLKREGLFPASAEQDRWRLDYTDGSYIVEYQVPIRLTEQKG